MLGYLTLIGPWFLEPPPQFPLEFISSFFAMEAVRDWSGMMARQVGLFALGADNRVQLWWHHGISTDTLSSLSPQFLYLLL